MAMGLIMAMVQARIITVRPIGRRRRCNLITTQAAVTGTTVDMADMEVTAGTEVTADKAIADRNRCGSSINPVSDVPAD